MREYGMIALHKTNMRKRVEAETALIDMLSQGLHRGFFGVLTLKLEIQDGVIQIIRTTVDKIRTAN